MKFRECRVDISFSFVVADPDQKSLQQLMTDIGQFDPWLRTVLPNRTIGPVRVEANLGDAKAIDMGAK